MPGSVQRLSRVRALTKDAASMGRDYGQDLAHIHNAGFGQLAEAAGPVLIDALSRCGHESGVVFDLGCGSGILSAVLLDAGYQVRGIDISPAMISIARRKVAGARFEVGSIFSAGLTECVAVAAVGECLNYLFDAGHFKLQRRLRNSTKSRRRWTSARLWNFALRYRRARTNRLKQPAPRIHGSQGLGGSRRKRGR